MEMPRKSLISIITSVHNELSLNQVFFEMLKKYTYYNFELIVVDNASVDGSGDFFRSVGATVLTQSKNYNYSKAMNIGTKEATGDYICHINNDVIVGLNWDRHLIDAMQDYGLDFVWPASIEVMPTFTETRKFLKKWKKIWRPSSSVKKQDILNAWVRMYGHWEVFCIKFAQKNIGKLLDGINGHTLMMTRSGWEKIGCYDEKMLATDWDIYFTVKKIGVNYGNIIAPKVVLWSFVHHFMGITSKVTKCAYDYDVEPYKNIEQKWSIEQIKKYHPFPFYVYPAPNFKEQPLAYLRYAFKRFFNLYKWGDRW